MPDADPGQIVSAGYDAIAIRYARWAATIESPAESWLDDLLGRLADGSSVLELGCGCGVPTARRLAERHEVLGVDISGAQVALARDNVPKGTFLHADALLLELAPASVDAVVCLYVFGHLPPADGAELVRRIAGWLRPGGHLLVTMGAGAEDAEPCIEDWLGVPMYFGAVGRETSLRWLESAGLDVLRAEAESQVEHGEEILFLWVLGKKRQ